MPDLEQHMDDLFRKAAENYQLEPGESNWDKISPALLNNPVIHPSVGAKKTNKQKVVALLLLSFLVAGGIITTDWENKKDKTSPQNGSNIKGVTNVVTEEIPGVSYKQSAAGSSIVNNSSLPQNPRPPSDNSILLTKKEWRKDLTGSMLNKPILSEQFVVVKKAFQNISAELTGNEKDNAAGSPADTKQSPEGSVLDRLHIMNKNVSTEINIDQERKGVPVQNLVKKRATGLSEQRSFYIGIAAGPSFNEVKQQGLNKPGFSAGIISGYQFNRKIAVETGLLFAKKTYFSEGKYFNQDKISSSVPTGMQIVSLEGNLCDWEIPVKLKYNYWQKNNNRIFSSAGITSYVTTYEKNKYLVLINGIQQNMFSAYKNKSRSFAAALDLSLGYEHKIGKFNSIRIEPYVQIPLKGMGVGSMPVMSSGLRIGLIKFSH